MALTDKLAAIGDAIRAQTGKEEKLTLDQMPDEIAGISGGGGGEDVTAETAEYTEKLSTLETAITELEEELGRKASGGGGDVGGLTQHARVYATPEIGGLFTITNPLGGLARKITITCPDGSPTLTASGMIQKCTMDADVGLGSLYYIHATNGAISCTGTRQEATANANARFAISEGLINAKSYASSNGTWDTTCEYVIDIWQ